MSSPSVLPGPAPDNWDDHWDAFGAVAQGNPANTYRHRLVLGHLGPLPAGARVLDIGSGQGELAAFLRRRYGGVDIWGLEHSSEGVRRARAMAEASGLDIRFACRDLLQATELASTDRGWATHATCSEVLEHVDRPDVLLRHARDYLAPACRLVVTVPGGPRTAFDRHIGHRQHFTPDSLRRTLEAGGFEVLGIQRAGAPFFNLYRLMVMLTSSRLIESSRSGGPNRPTRSLQIAYRLFDASFRFNLPTSPFGWQLVAVATPRSA